MITGTLPIYSAPFAALFDSGSMHTFIVKTFVDRIGVYVKDLGYDLVVSTPTRVILTAIVYVGVSLKLSSSTYC